MNDIYTNIDELPIYNFDMISRTGNLQYLGKKNIDKIKVEKSFEDVWENIFNEYIQEFGINEQFKFYLMYQLEAIKYYDKAYNKGSRSDLTLAKVAERKANELLSENNDISLGKIASMMLMKMGQRINIREISVREFYNNILLLQENNG